MKKTILLTLTLIISYASMSQNYKDTLKLNVSGRLVSGLTSDLGQPISKLLVSGTVDNGDKLQFYDHKNTREILRLNPKGDTLEIKSSSIKYIKIDGKTYEIRRTTKLINQEEGKTQYTKEELNFLNSAHGTDDYNRRLGIINLLKRNQK